MLVVVCCVNSLRMIALRPCRQVECSTFCPNGYVTIRGCQTCQCKAEVPITPVCGPVCRVFCPYGFELDKRGCPTCTCRQCPLIKCSRQCPNGYKYVRGCQTCTCKDPPLTPVCGPICRLRCPNGFVEDSRGCPICRCKPFLGPCRPAVCSRMCLSGEPQPFGCECPPCGRWDRNVYQP